MVVFSSWKERTEIEKLGRQKSENLIELSPSCVDGELHVFALWPNGHRHREKFLEVLTSIFGRLALFEVDWTDDGATRNLQRLYGVSEDMSERLALIGKGTITVAVVRDFSPEYKLELTPSRILEDANHRVVGAKNYLRAITETPTFKYLVHSSNSSSEASRDIFLLLGQSWFEKILSGEWPQSTIRLRTDLEGSKGWASASDLVDFLNSGVRYAVLRPGSSREYPLGAGGDLDLLTENQEATASSTNATPTRGDGLGNHFQVKVGDSSITLDIRQIGDSDADPRWQEHMLANRTLKDGIFVLQDEDMFFYLIYHAFFHSQGKMSPARVGQIATLGRVVLSSSLVRFTDEEGGFSNPVILAWLLNRFLTSKGYIFAQNRILGSRKDPSFETFLEQSAAYDSKYFTWKQRLNLDLVSQALSDSNPLLGRLV